MRLLLGVAWIACGIALARPGSAFAGWPLESGGTVALGFGATYHSAEQTSGVVHHGVDLAAQPGDAVVAPIAGRVTFAGRIPAAGGGSALAVTLSTPSGSLTLMPLERAAVGKGSELDAGASVGRLAAGGDGSSAGTHLHVGLKRGELYLDPLTVMSAPAVAPSGTGTSGSLQGSGKTAGAGVVVSAGAAHGSASPRTPEGDGATRSGLGDGATAGARGALRAALPGMQLAPGVSVAGAGAVEAPAGTSAAAPWAAQTLSARRLPSPAAHGAPAASGGLTVAALADRLRSLATAGIRTMSLGLLGMLAGIGALWPLWRRGPRKGSGESRVSTMQEDIAAVVGR